jgi:hypothetical protein
VGKKAASHRDAAFFMNWSRGGPLAFSSEVESGSREENASKSKDSN